MTRTMSQHSAWCADAAGCHALDAVELARPTRAVEKTTQSNAERCVFRPGSRKWPFATEHLNEQKWRRREPEEGV